MFQPMIDPQVIALTPDFRALSLLLTCTTPTAANPAIAAQALAQATHTVLAGGPEWAEPHLQAWREVFRRFGAKPQRTPCSAESLRKRLLRDGALPALDPVVDLYNAISLRYALPVGGENAAAYQGAPRLVVAQGDESFDTLKEGQPVLEQAEAGEVIWRDEQGVTCRRWNWRQGIRTRLDSTAQQMWFVLESLGAMPEAALEAAGQELARGLEAMFPGAEIKLSHLP